MKHTLKILSTILLLMVLIISTTACNSELENDFVLPNKQSVSLENIRPTAISAISDLNVLSIKKENIRIHTTKNAQIIPDNRGIVIEGYSVNEDTIAWLTIPNTYIDTFVVRNRESNNDYIRKDFFGAMSFSGSIALDYRAELSSGYRKELSLNTSLYGNTLIENSEDSDYLLGASSLHALRTKEIAEDTPYIFYSTMEHTYAFEIFAAFVVNADNIPYNSPSSDPDEFLMLVQDEVVPRSIWDYEDITFDKDDKFLTLSTNIYTLESGEDTGYPDTMYRFAVMAKLVPEDATLKEKAILTPNKDAIVDPDGPMSSQG